MPRTGTHAHSRSRMQSAAPLCPPPPTLLMLLLLLLLSSTTGAQLLDEPYEEELIPRALRDFYPKRPNLTSEKQLVRLKSTCNRREASLMILILVLHFGPIRLRPWATFFSTFQTFMTIFKDSSG